MLVVAEQLRTTPTAFQGASLNIEPLQNRILMNAAKVTYRIKNAYGVKLVNGIGPRGNRICGSSQDAFEVLDQDPRNFLFDKGMIMIIFSSKKEWETG